MTRDIEAELRAAIERHEAFRQEVSDAVEDALPWTQPGCCISVAQRNRLTSFVIPKPDPIFGVIEDLRADGHMNPTVRETANRLRQALDARGLEIVEKKP